MRLWWRRKRTSPQVGTPTVEAVSAAAEAARGRQDTEALAGRVDDVAERLKRTHDRNHFGPAVARAFRGA